MIDVRPRYTLWKYDDDFLGDNNDTDELQINYDTLQDMKISTCRAEGHTILRSNVTYRKLSDEERERFIKLLQE